MGKKVVVFCDRCGKDVTDKPYVGITLQLRDYTDKFLCSQESDNCWDKFREWLREPQSS